jgi:hypothetical protein
MAQSRVSRLFRHGCEGGIAHFSAGDGPEAWGWAAGSSVLWGLSYFFWCRVQTASAIA